jgi:hypothetical protein
MILREDLRMRGGTRELLLAIVVLAVLALVLLLLRQAG